MSCSQDDDILDTYQSIVDEAENNDIVFATRSAYSYSVTPDSGYTQNSPSGFVLPSGNGYGSALGGVIKAYVEQTGSNVYTITVSKQDNSSFSTSGQILLHERSVTGDPIDYMYTSAGKYSYSLSFSLPAGAPDYGVIHFFS